MKPVADINNKQKQQTQGTHSVFWPPAPYSQVKQKLYVTSKLLLFKVIFTLQHWGNEERVSFALGYGQKLVSLAHVGSQPHFRPDSGGGGAVCLVRLGTSVITDAQWTKTVSLLSPHSLKF